MRLICSLPKAARIVMWLTILSTLLGLILGYQAGSSAANPADTGRPAAVAPVDDRN
jgi:hypothetical protein